jgi:hypothetical protein
MYEFPQNAKILSLISSLRVCATPQSKSGCEFSSEVNPEVPSSHFTFKR